MYIVYIPESGHIFPRLGNQILRGAGSRCRLHRGGGADEGELFLSSAVAKPLNDAQGRNKSMD